MTDQRPTQPNIRIDVPEDQRGGVWANMARVTHSTYEFTIDFARLDFAAPGPDLSGVVVARVNLSPLLVTQLIEALNTNWDNYAARALPPEAGGTN